MILEPARRHLDHVVEGTGFLEQMSCAFDDVERPRTAQTCERIAIEREHVAIVCSDDQQRRRLNDREGSTGEIRTPPSRHHCTSENASRAPPTRQDSDQAGISNRRSTERPLPRS